MNKTHTCFIILLCCLLSAEAKDHKTTTGRNTVTENKGNSAQTKSLEGKTAPAFTLEGSDGEKHSLKDYIGKNVVIYFYPKDDTPGCTKEACGFRDLKKNLSSLNAVVLGVSSDSIASHNSFIEKFNLSFILLSDPDRK